MRDHKDLAGNSSMSRFPDFRCRLTLSKKLDRGYLESILLGLRISLNRGVDYLA